MATRKPQAAALPAADKPIPTMDLLVDRSDEQALLEQMIEARHNDTIEQIDSTDAPAPAPVHVAREWGPYFTEAEMDLLLSRMLDVDVAAPFSKRWRFLMPLSPVEAAALRQAVSALHVDPALDLKQAIAAARTIAGAATRARVGYSLDCEVRL